MVINMHVTIFYYNMDGCTEPGNFPDWTKILTSAGDMVQNVFNNDEWGLSVEIILRINSNDYRSPRPISTSTETTSTDVHLDC